MKSISNCDRVYFHHMRKAAGTSVRRLLERTCDARGLVLDVVEGLPLDPQRLADPRTFLVTNLREPLDRICSLYNAEGRWRMYEPDRAATPGVGLDVWLVAERPDAAPALWNEPVDYYTKSLAGFVDGPRRNEDVGRARGQSCDAVAYRSARQAFDCFDMVFVAERLACAGHRAYLARCMELDESALLMGHRNRTRNIQDRYDVREHLAPDQLASLITANRWDSELYRYAYWKVTGEVAPESGSGLTARGAGAGQEIGERG